MSDEQILEDSKEMFKQKVHGACTVHTGNLKIYARSKKLQSSYQ